jgi:hypothetical protein
VDPEVTDWIVLFFSVIFFVLGYGCGRIHGLAIQRRELSDLATRLERANARLQSAVDANQPKE